MQKADHVIGCSFFDVEYDGAFDFLINQKFCVHELVKVSEFEITANLK